MGLESPFTYKQKKTATLKSLSPRERQFWDLYHSPSLWKPPSNQSIANIMGVDRSTVQEFKKKIINKGFVFKTLKSLDKSVSELLG